MFSKPGDTIVSPKSSFPTLTKQPSTCQWFIVVGEGKKVKLWFKLLRLEKNSSILIRDGNSSTSEVLKKITYNSEEQNDDIYSKSNVVSIWYKYHRKFNLRNSTGFQLSYDTIGR